MPGQVPPPVPMGPPTGSVYEPVTDRMSMDDVVVRTGISIAVLIPFALIGWNLAPTMPFLYIGSMILGLVLGLVNAFKKVVSPPLILAYAAVQGVFLGGISYVYDQWAQGTGYEGLVSQAIIGTLVAFVVMLALYRSRLVKVDGRFKKIMMVAFVSYLAIALMSFVSSFFGVGRWLGLLRRGHAGPDPVRLRRPAGRVQPDAGLRLDRARRARWACPSGSRGGWPSACSSR